MSNIPIKGGPELLAFLDAFPKKIQNGAARAGAVAAAKPVRDEARRLARKKSGAMAKGIKTGSPRIEGDTVRVRVRLTGKHAFLGFFHEYGVKPHLIKVADAVVDEVEAGLKPLKSGRRRAKATLMRHVNRKIRDASLVINGKFVGTEVHHPGIAPSPFMRPALDSQAAAAVNAFGERMRTYLSSKAGFTAPVTIEVEDDE